MTVDWMKPVSFGLDMAYTADVCQGCFDVSGCGQQKTLVLRTAHISWRWAKLFQGGGKSSRSIVSFFRIVEVMRVKMSRSPHRARTHLSNHRVHADLGDPIIFSRKLQKGKSQI